MTESRIDYTTSPEEPIPLSFPELENKVKASHTLYSDEFISYVYTLNEKGVKWREIAGTANGIVIEREETHWIDCPFCAKRKPYYSPYPKIAKVRMAEFGGKIKDVEKTIYGCTQTLHRDSEHVLDPANKPWQSVVNRINFSKHYVRR